MTDTELLDLLSELVEEQHGLYEIAIIATGTLRESIAAAASDTSSYREGE